MNKAPAFQFYAGDFLVGVMGMSDEEVGVYIKMLAMQWERGSLPNCPKSIRFLVNSRRNPSENVMKKFTISDDGTIRNDRLEKERQKQITFRESRVENAKKRWEKQSTSNARALSSTCKKDALQSSSSSSSSKFVPPSVEEVRQYGYTLTPVFSDAGKFVNFYESKGWKVGKNPMKSWQAAVRNWNSSNDGKTTETGTRPLF